MTISTAIDESSPLTGAAWRDQLEATVREHVRGFIEELVEAELCEFLGRGRYVCKPASTEPRAAAEKQEGLGDDVPAAAPVPTFDDGVRGHRNGCRERTIMGTFGKLTVSVPRARLDMPDGKTAEWVNTTLPKYRRRTKEVDALIAGAYLSGTNTRRVGRALASLFKGAVSKSVVSRVWRKIKADWDNWNKRDLANEDIVRLILDGTHVKVRMDKKATGVSLLVVLGIRRDGQKVLLAVKNMGGESEAAWRTILDDLTNTIDRND